MSDSNKAYQFTISGNTVTAVYEVERGHVKVERMDSDETWSFDGTNVIKTEWDDGRLETTTYTDANSDGLFLKTSKTYSDARTDDGHDDAHDRGHDDNDHDGRDGTDADHGGVFRNGFELETVSGSHLRKLETYKFSLSDGSNATGDLAAEGDMISGMMELGHRGWKVERIDANESLQVVEVNGDNLILQTKTQWNGELDFSVFRDDDHDGLWTEIATGETRDAFVTQDGDIDLVGIVHAGLLRTADALIA